MKRFEELGKILKTLGIDIFDENDNYRPFGDVILDISDVYNMLNKKTQDKIKKLLLEKGEE